MKNEPFTYSIEKTPNRKYTVITLSYTPTNEKNSPITVRIAPTLGSNMFQFRVGNHDIIYHEAELLASCGFTGNFVLFPTPNRVEGSTYEWEGKRIVLKKRGKFVLLHGLVFDEPWQWAKPIVAKTYVSVKTYISIGKKSRLFNAFPFPCRLTLEYRLTAGGIRIHYTVQNLGSESLPYGFALHPYFSRLSGDDETYITIPAKSWMESPNDTLLPNGTLIDVSGKPYNVNTPRPVGKLSLDHVYTDLKPGKFATIDYRSLKLKVRLETSKDFTHMVVYTGHKKAVCIENQTCSTDAHNLWARGFKKESHLMVIPKGKKHTGHITYKIEEY